MRVSFDSLKLNKYIEYDKNMNKLLKFSLKDNSFLNLCYEIVYEDCMKNTWPMPKIALLAT